MSSTNKLRRPRVGSPVAKAAVGTMTLLVPLAGVLGVMVSLGASWQSTAMTILIAIVAVTGTGVYSGNSGILSFGHVAFMGIGAYLAGLLVMTSEVKATSLPELPGWLASTTVGPWAALVITAAAVAVVTLPVGYLFSKFAGMSAAIATFGVLIVANTILLGASDFTRGSQTFFGVPAYTTWAMALVCVAVTIFGARLFKESRVGLQLRASREDEESAASMGINIPRVRLYAWTLSAALVPLAGVLYAGFLTAFSPGAFYLDLTFTYIAMLIFGGWTSVSGAVVGAVVVGLLTEILGRAQNEGVLGTSFFGLPQIGLAVSILVILYFMPKGVLGYRELDEFVSNRLGALRRSRTSRRSGAKKAASGASTLRVEVGDLSMAPDETVVARDADEPLRGHRSSVLSAKNVSMRFAGLQALRDVSFTMTAGEVVGLIGPNGSGKTTLLNILSGVQRPTSGSVLADEVEIVGRPLHSVIRLGIARTHQNIRLFGNLSVRENVAIGAHAALGNEDDLVTSRLASFGLADVAQSPANALPYGGQRRLEIARALAAQPDFVFLDEPAAGMNDAESDDLLDKLNEISAVHGIGILIVDHDLRLMTRLCHRIVVLNQGELIAEGTPDEVINNAAVSEAYLGTAAAPTHKENYAS
jgi:branched-chain amino acid transport system permease protein